MAKFPKECPYCETALELDTNYDGDDIVCTIICPNSDCEKDFAIEFSRTSQAQAERKYEDFLKKASKK